jgi:hypothetical protein
MSDPQVHAAPPLEAEHDPRPEPPEPPETPQAQVPGDEPRPLGIGVQPTGHPGVDEQLARLADADRLPVSAHLEVYEEAHRALRDTLTALDQQRPGPVPAPGPAPGPGPVPRRS